MAAGENFSVFATDSNGLFTCGSNTFGELATGDDQKPGTTFNYVKGLEDKFIEQISCGSNHAMALTSDGEVYSWGLNFVGQLGLGKISHPECETQLVRSMLTSSRS